MKTVETLKASETLLVSAKVVNGGKIQLEFAEKLESASNSVASIFNASDERFSQSGVRRAWQAGEAKDLTKIFGVDFSSLTEYGTTMDLGILNPEFNGERLRVQIVETTEPKDEYLLNNPDRAKRAGKDGDYLLKDGKLIYSITQLIIGEPKNVFIQHNGTTNEPVSSTETESLSKISAKDLMEA